MISGVEVGRYCFDAISRSSFRHANSRDVMGWIQNSILVVKYSLQFLDECFKRHAGICHAEVVGHQAAVAYRRSLEECDKKRRPLRGEVRMNVRSE